MSEYATYSDHALLVSFLAGEEMAYKAIYDRYWQLLYRFARKLLQDNSMAEDIVQDVFTTLWEKKAQLDQDTPLAALLYKVTRNRVLDRIKHSTVKERYLDELKKVLDQRSDLPDELYIERELYDRIEAEIANLPERMRLIFEMSRKEFKTTEQIAEELGLSQQTIKNQISNAIRNLKRKFGDSLHIFLIFF